MTVLLIIFGVLVAARAIMFLCMEQEASPQYKPISPPAGKVGSPTEHKPQETVHGTLLIGRYKRKVSLPLNPEVEVGYIIPIDPSGKPLPGTENMIFYAPFNGEGNKTPCSQPWLQELARRSDCSVFSLQIKMNYEIVRDRKKYYIYPESGWFDIVFDVQHKLAERFHLPRRRLMLVGESSGGSMVQQISAAYPERIAAAAWCGGSRYELSNIRYDGIPRLILSTWGCPGEQNSEELSQKLRRQDNPVLFSSMPPDFRLNEWYHHAPGNNSYQLIQDFIKEVAGQNAKYAESLSGSNVRKKYSFSEAFMRHWNERFKPYALYDLQNTYIMKPYAADAKRIVIAVSPVRGNFSIMAKDALYCLSKSNAIPIWIALEDDWIGARMLIDQALKTIIQSSKWQGLPIDIMGFGEAGMPGAIEAIRSDHMRIRKIVLFGTSHLSPFSELSITENRTKNRIPLIIYSETGDEGVRPANTEFRVFSPEKLTNSSWHAMVQKL